jgi:hypothetical protein
MERTEEQKVAQVPVTVIFGGKQFEIKPLVIKESREWRQKVIKVLSELPQLTQVTSEDKEKFDSALSTLLITMPDTVVNLFFEYAKDLNREEIENVATDSEMALAWEKVVQLAFPLLQGLVKTMAKMVQ